MKLREIFGRVQQLRKMAQLKTYPTVPFSSLTARSDLAANGSDEAPNEYTREEQRFIEMLLSAMSKSRARVVDARRNARQSVGG